jgi:hypothetical protein
MFKDKFVNTIADFISKIGIEIVPDSFEEETVLPGIKIDSGKIIVDEKKLLYPGDLLHEAGHIAVKPGSERLSTSINVGNDPAEEMMSMAWSYAAAVNIGIPPEVVFHPHGYHGQSESLIRNFQSNNCIGLPMLQWVDMCADYKNAPSLGVSPFPFMIKWLRD